MALVMKKEEKLQNIVESMKDGYTKDEFVHKFEETYPKDWKKILNSYKEHERKTKEGKTHPMPEPKQYVLNMLNVWLKKNK